MMVAWNCCRELHAAKERVHKQTVHMMQAGAGTIQRVYKGHRARAYIRRKWQWDYAKIVQARLRQAACRVAALCIQRAFRTYMRNREYVARVRLKREQRLAKRRAFDGNVLMRRVRLVNDFASVGVVCQRDSDKLKIEVEAGSSAEADGEVGHGRAVVWRVKRMDTGRLVRIVVLTEWCPRSVCTCPPACPYKAFTATPHRAASSQVPCALSGAKMQTACGCPFHPLLGTSQTVRMLHASSRRAGRDPRIAERDGGLPKLSPLLPLSLPPSLLFIASVCPLLRVLLSCFYSFTFLQIHAYVSNAKQTIPVAKVSASKLRCHGFQSVLGTCICALGASLGDTPAFSRTYVHTGTRL
jgi:hypothetical protein